MRQRGVTGFALERLPRITRAQTMDVLSSQANIAGYKAVIIAADQYRRFMPMLMTAAGTVKAARVLVLGAGVAGLQAIATAKRLGAVIEAFDVRPATKEQVESLGAKFVEVPVSEEERQQAETAGGYARQMSDEYQRRQSALIDERARAADIIITTALVPGKPAPVLIREETIRAMKPGSVLVDLAVEQGGNCPLTRKGSRRRETRRHAGRAIRTCRRCLRRMRAHSTHATCSRSSTCWSIRSRARRTSTVATRSSPARSSASMAPS